MLRERWRASLKSPIWQQALLECWPVRAYAPQRLWFADDGLSLTLHTGEAETILAGLDGAFDAWFLDGFAPARNAGMWSEEVFRNIAQAFRG